jgi:hypothetical protein
MANPTWTDDERILALDLYLREGPLGPSHPEVVELSRLLRSMAATTEVGETYRNPNGVSKKLYNFADLDGKSGLPGWGAGDKRLFERYRDQREELRAAASAIREKAAAAAPRSYARHLLLKWQPALEPRTLELHKEKAAQAGSVWWGNYTEHGRRVSDAVVEDLDAQIAAGIPTYAFFGSCD